MKAIEIIKKFEGFSSTVYHCPAGYPTIGYGHVVTPEEAGQFKDGITKDEAERLLENDVMRFKLVVISLLKAVKLHDYSIDALTSFTFNCGLYAFRASTLRRKILHRDYKDAADEFLKWVYAGGKRLRGLVLRRQAERALYLEGLEMNSYYRPN